MAQQRSQAGSTITRRRFVRDAGLATVAATDYLAGPAVAARKRIQRRRRSTVAVFGGGVAGLTAAHELAERGFDVTVYERRAWGGKARSIDVPQSATGGRRPLPAEHGFREIFAGYQNLPDTMRRIPFGSNRDGVYGNLVTRHHLVLSSRSGPDALHSTRQRAQTAGDDADRGRQHIGRVSLLAAALGRCAPRRSVGGVSVQRHAPQIRSVGVGDLGGLRASRSIQRGWTPRLRQLPDPVRCPDTRRTDERSDDRANVGVDLLPRAAGTRRHPRPGRSDERGMDRPVDGPRTRPWCPDAVGAQGHCADDGPRQDHQSHGSGAAWSEDRARGWYVVALPVDWATKLWSKDILAADPQLARSFNITGGWMTGIQLYLRKTTPITAGPVTRLDSPWAIAGISQAQFWKGRDFAADYGDGSVRDKFSAVIVDWDTPGVLYGKKARDCTGAEIAAETWAQLKAHFTYPGAPPMPDDQLAGTFLDPGIQWNGNTITSYDDPLPRCNPGTWYDRPDVASRIPNLFLAGDYVKVDFDITSMEGANEAARRAVNALLDRAGSTQPQVHAYDRSLPGEWVTLRKLDDQRFAAGEPNLFDAPLSIGEIKNILSQPIAALTGATTGLHHG